MISDFDKTEWDYSKDTHPAFQWKIFGPYSHKRSLMAHHKRGGGKYYVNYLGRLIFLDFGFFWWIAFGYPHLPHNSKKIEPQCQKRSLVAHKISKIPTIKRIPRCYLMLIKLNEIIVEVPFLPPNKKIVP